jgi:hypothetical protein
MIFVTAVVKEVAGRRRRPWSARASEFDSFAE